MDAEVSPVLMFPTAPVVQLECRVSASTGDWLAGPSRVVWWPPPPSSARPGPTGPPHARAVHRSLMRSQSLG